MEAKDTLEPCGNIHCRLDCHKKQAEISFKAGRKEVVEFVEDSIPKTLANYVGFWQNWQAKLKEWGL